MRDELYTEKVKEAFALFEKLTDDERGTVMSWFCRGCYRYLGPGDRCYCQNDE